MDGTKAQEFAKDWIEAWNSHDLDRIVEHYVDEIILTSPVAARLLNDPSGTVRGKAALRSYFAHALELYPELRFELFETMIGLNSLVLYYRNQIGTMAGEYMELDAHGKVTRVVAHYSQT